MSNKQERVIDAKQEPPCNVMSDILMEIISYKKCTLLFSLLICTIPFALLIMCSEGNPSAISNLVETMSSANLAMIGFDIAALAIIITMFNNEIIKGQGKDAFNEQVISFVGNAIFQLIVLILSFYYTLLKSNMTFCYLTVFLQLWALILVFDLIIELYTLKSKIINKTN